MYNAAYLEVCENMAEKQRGDERELLQLVISQLKALDTNDLQSVTAINAMYRTTRLWTLFIDDLSSDENDLPDALKADLISIGIYVVGELERIREGESDDIASVIAINEIIYKGLE